MIPFFQKPPWCLYDPQLTNTANCDTHHGIYINSGLPKLPRYLSIPLNLFVILALLGYKLIQRLYKHHDKESQKMETLQITLLSISLLDIFANIVIPEYKFSYVSSIVRPFYFVFAQQTLRTTWMRFIYVMWDSAPMVIFISCYMLYFSWVGQRLFKGTPEGIMNFPNFGAGAYGILVLMTTANFPDFMLPAYHVRRINCIFFIFYLIFGLFLLMNMLLAIFYSQFHARFQQKIESFVSQRNNYLMQKFNDLDKGGKGYLDKEESYQMFKELERLDNEGDHEEGISFDKFTLLFNLIDEDGNE